MTLNDTMLLPSRVTTLVLACGSLFLTGEHSRFLECKYDSTSHGVVHCAEEGI